MSRRRPSLFWPSVKAFFLLWTPRLPFLTSTRFWTWSLGTFSVSFASLMVGLRVMRAARIDPVEVVAAALVITVPVTWIAWAVYTWRDRVNERRGFAARQDDVDEPEL